MSIDEAIEKYREKGNPYGTCCEGCEKEHEQLAEWLEELKSYRASVFSGDMTQTMLKEQYCKALADFVEELQDYSIIPHAVRAAEMKAEPPQAGGEND